MAELTIDPASIRKALDDFVSSYKPSDTPTQEVGYVATAGDGIAHVTGLPGCMANELLTFEDGTLGLAFNLDAREIGVVILGDFAGIEEGQEVRRTGEVLSVPVGDGYLGRVVDPLGKPLDGLGEIQGIEGLVFLNTIIIIWLYIRRKMAVCIFVKMAKKKLKYWKVWEMKRMTLLLMRKSGTIRWS